MKEWIRRLERVSFRSGTYSQSYQDALLAVIFDEIGSTNAPPFCVEIGFDSTSLTAGGGSNTARLVLHENWAALLLDGANENPAINLRRHFLTSANICDVFRRYDVPREPEYISIDVDSTDLWLFEALLGCYRARLFSVEYNSHFPLDSAITFPDNPEMRWEEDRGYGASLRALCLVAEQHGYSLLWVVPGLDAFFIRNDLIEDGSGTLVFPLEKWRHCTGIVQHRPLRTPARAGLFLDYEVLLQTGGDLALSRQAAHPVCRRYLQDSVAQQLLGLARAATRKLRDGLRGQAATT